MRNWGSFSVVCLYCIAIIGCSPSYGPQAQLATSDYRALRDLPNTATSGAQLKGGRSTAQQVELYDNGPDPGGSCRCPYFAVNFGYGVTDSFTLAHPAQLTQLKFDVYTVNDENDPYAADWAITSEPFGGTVYASADRQTLTLFENPWYTRSGYIAFPESLQLPEVQLQPGTYWIQLESVRTPWDTWAFWPKSLLAPSRAYQAILPRTQSPITPIASEVFQIWGTTEQSPRS
jgi:hypothetical protein